MKFYTVFSGRKHRVAFKHIFGDTLVVLSIDVNGAWVPIKEECASCNPRDQYNKWFGRKLALSRLSKILKPEHRNELWAKYFEAIAEQLVDKAPSVPTSAYNRLMHYNQVATAWKEAINPKCRTYPVKKFIPPTPYPEY